MRVTFLILFVTALVLKAEGLPLEELRVREKEGPRQIRAPSDDLKTAHSYGLAHYAFPSYWSYDWVNPYYSYYDLYSYGHGLGYGHGYYGHGYGYPYYGYYGYYPYGYYNSFPYYGYYGYLHR